MSIWSVIILGINVTKFNSCSILIIIFANKDAKVEREREREVSNSDISIWNLYFGGLGSQLRNELRLSSDVSRFSDEMVVVHFELSLLENV